MGNSQPRYFSEKESREVIGYATAERLSAQLKGYCDFGHYVDYEIFSSVLSAYFESMPPKLYEYLWAAFANDIQSKIEIKDFISALAAILSNGSDKTHQRRFLFRVYDVEGRGELDKLRVERVVMAAHSETLNKPAAITELKALFSNSSHARYMTQKEFEGYSGTLDILSGWVRAVLTIFTEPSSTKLSSLERRYSVALEAEQMMDRFGVEREMCDQLRRLFYRHCEASLSSSGGAGVQEGGEGKAELTEAAWVKWTAGFLDPELAEVLFRAKLTGLKHVWRFPDFAEFCMIFGMSHSDETKAAFLCVLFQQYALNCEQRETLQSHNHSHRSTSGSDSEGRGRSCDMKPSVACDETDGGGKKGGDEDDSRMELEREERDNLSHHSDSLQLMAIMRRLLHLLSLPPASMAPTVYSPVFPVNSSRPLAPLSHLPPMDSALEARLQQLEESFLQPNNTAGPSAYTTTDANSDHVEHTDAPSSTGRPGGGGATLQAYVTFICDNTHSLPGVQLLSMSACCLFGLRPPSPELEKVYITELMLWGQAVTLQDADQPHGPEGAEWALISTSWWDSWRYYVGRSSTSPQHPPGEISNFSLLKKSSSVAQLLPGLLLKRDFEAVPLQVFTALQSWYGGGPPVLRQVVRGLLHAGGVPREHVGSNTGGDGSGISQRPLLELFPLCLKVYTCDRQGRPRETYPRELLCSAVSTVADLLARLQALRGGSDADFDPSKARLWSSFHPPPPARGGGISTSSATSMSAGSSVDSDWRQQRVLTPELRLQAAGLQHDDCLLLEVSLSDGSWPKSKLHALLEAEELRKTSISGQAELPFSPLSPLHGDGVIMLNDGGKVGLDNLGNTCYLNSSLQALLHTPHLVEYFLRKTHLREVNQHSKFGFKGRLAFAFGKLASDLWVPRGENQRQKERGGKGGISGAASSALSTLKSIGTGGIGGIGDAGGGSSVSPHKFRKELMALHEQFDNNEQHDAQELLTFLLDGLSEDLNLVHEKPYVQQPDSDSHTPDKELAAIWWENHLKREHSVMQSLFTGQFKSITRCVQDDCTYHSARFEPFNMLSLPLPDNEQRVVMVYVVTRGIASASGCGGRAGRLPVRCAVLVQKSSGTVGDIEAMLQTYVDLPGLEPELEGEGRREEPLQQQQKGVQEAEEEEKIEKPRLPRYCFLVCKLFRGKVAQIVDSSTSVDTIKDSDDLFFYQVLLEEDVLQLGQNTPILDSSALSVTVPNPSDHTTSSHPCSKRPLHSPTSPSSSPSPTGSSSLISISSSTGHTSKRADTRPEREPAITTSSSSPTSLPLPVSKQDLQNSDDRDMSGPVEMDIVEHGDEGAKVHATTVILVHRRVHSSFNHQSNHQHSLSQGGLKLFRMQAVGLPLLESLPSRIHARSLYEAVERRVRGCFKTSILDLQRRNNSGISDHVSQYHDHPSSSPHKVRPIATEDAVGGDIPPFGFVLRLVKLNGDCCSRCHWLNRCEGCLIPYPTLSPPSSSSKDEMIELSPLQAIAIDWHYIVYHEALEPFPFSDSGRLPLSAITHRSVGVHNLRQSQSLPLQKCLQKFTEEEALDDMVCPTCKHSDGCLRRSFALWRLPPVLIVQLKRFQFNSYSRRKLTNQVDFPFEGLDLSCYLAPSHELSPHFQLYQQQQQEKKEKEQEQKEGRTVNKTSGENKCPDGELASKDVDDPPECLPCTNGTVYDLYSTVHHVGALGGGHYVASARDDFGPLQSRLLRSPHCPSHSLPLSQISEQKRKDEQDDGDNDDGVCSAENCELKSVPGGEEDNRSGCGERSQEWFCYNDSVVSPTTPKEIAAGSSAYLLFYLRRDLRTASVSALHCPDTPSTYSSETESDVEQVNENICDSQLKGNSKNGGGREMGLPMDHGKPPVDMPQDSKVRSLPRSAAHATGTRFDVNFHDVDELTESDNAQCRVS